MSTLVSMWSLKGYAVYGLAFGDLERYKQRVCCIQEIPYMGLVVLFLGTVFVAISSPSNSRHAMAACTYKDESLLILQQNVAGWFSRLCTIYKEIS